MLLAKEECNGAQSLPLLPPGYLPLDGQPREPFRVIFMIPLHLSLEEILGIISKCRFLSSFVYRQRTCAAKVEKAYERTQILGGFTIIRGERRDDRAVRPGIIYYSWKRYACMVGIKYNPGACCRSN